MVSTYSTNLRLDLQGTGDNDATWGSVANAMFQALDQSVAGLVTVGLVDGTNTKTISDGAVSADIRCNTLWLTGGGLTTATNLTVPSKPKNWAVFNNCTSAGGGQGITVKTASGSGFLVPASTGIYLSCDGVSVRPVTPPVDGSGNVTFTSVAASTGSFNGLVATSASIGSGHFTGVLDVGATVSARALNITSSVNATYGQFTGLNVTNSVSANYGTFNNLQILGVVSASTATFAGNVSAANITASTGNFSTVNVGGAPVRQVLNFYTTTYSAATSTNVAYNPASGINTGLNVINYTFTPVSTASWFLIESVVPGGSTVTDSRFWAGIFTNTSTSYHQQNCQYSARANTATHTVPLKTHLNPGVVTPITVSIRAGSDGGTGQINGNSYGGYNAGPVFLCITEYSF